MVNRKKMGFEKFLTNQPGQVPGMIRAFKECCDHRVQARLIPGITPTPRRAKERYDF